MGKPILCLDFDGVLNSSISPWVGATHIPDPPVPGAIDFLQEARKTFTVVIHSSRFSDPGARPAVRDWLVRHGVDLGDISLDFSTAGPWGDKIYFSDLKPPAFLTIDDRAITFTGEFPSIETLLSFRPWNR